MISLPAGPCISLSPPRFSHRLRTRPSTPASSPASPPVNWPTRQRVNSPLASSRAAMMCLTPCVRPTPGRPGTVSPTSTHHKRPKPILKASPPAYFPLGKPTPKRPSRVGHFVLLDPPRPPLKGVGAGRRADARAAPSPRSYGQAAVKYKQARPENELYVKGFTPFND